METKHCPSCGEELPISSSFCPACFKELDVVGVVPSKSTVEWRWYKILVPTAILLIIVLLASIFLPSKNRNKVILSALPTETFTLVESSTPVETDDVPSSIPTTVISTTVAPTAGPVTKAPTATIAATGAASPTAAATPTQTIVPTQTTVPTQTVVPTQTTVPTQTVAPTQTTAPTQAATPTKTPNQDETLYTYRISNNKAVITNYSGAAKTVSIPAKLNGVQVCEIATKAFYNNDVIQEVYVPDSIQIIGDYVFSNCSDLKIVSMGDSVTTLGTEAFSQCDNLQSVRLSNKIKTIPASCFTNCGKLQSVNLPTSLTTILGSAFDNTAITALSIPATVTTLPNMFCAYMPKLEQIQVAGGNPVYWSQDGVLFKKNTWNSSSTLWVYPGGKKDLSYTLPNTADNIYANAFCKNPYLQTVTLAPQTSYINSYAFDHCTGLTTLITYNTLTTIQNGAFRDCPNLTLTVTEDSYAHTYAIDNDIPYILKQ